MCAGRVLRKMIFFMLTVGGVSSRQTEVFLLNYCAFEEVLLCLESVYKLTVSKRVVFPAKAGIQSF